MFTLKFHYNNGYYNDADAFYVSPDDIGFDAIRKIATTLNCSPQTLDFVGEFGVRHKYLEIKLGIDDVKTFGLQQFFSDTRCRFVSLPGNLNAYSKIFVIQDEESPETITLDLTIDRDAIVEDFLNENITARRINKKFSAKDCLIFEKDK